jgi:hypothetical protein
VKAIKRSKTDINLPDSQTMAKITRNLSSQKMQQQSYTAAKISTDIFRFSVNDEFVCTATKVGNYVFVVLHALVEDPSVSYRISNHVGNYELSIRHFHVVDDHMGAFYLPGYPSTLKKKHLTIPKKSCVVTSIGYFENTEHPITRTGFATPEGFAGMENREGLCSSPVIEPSGKVIGFWTHGNSKRVGRFQPVTEEAIKLVGSNNQTLHVGLGFH